MKNVIIVWKKAKKEDYFTASKEKMKIRLRVRSRSEYAKAVILTL